MIQVVYFNSIHLFNVKRTRETHHKNYNEFDFNKATTCYSNGYLIKKQKFPNQ